MSKITNKDIISKINKGIESVRPYLVTDGGMLNL